MSPELFTRPPLRARVISSSPVRLWVEWQPVLITSDHVTAFLFTLLGGVVVLFTQRLPVSLIPEELPSLRYLFLIATLQCFLQLMWTYVVNHHCRDCPALATTHDT